MKPLRNVHANVFSFLVCKYSIETYTGDVDNAETLAIPYISLHGQTGNSGKRKLLASTNTEPQDMFRRGKVCSIYLVIFSVSTVLINVMKCVYNV